VRLVISGDSKVIVNNDILYVSILSELQHECSRSLPVVAIELLKSDVLIVLRLEKRLDFNIVSLVSHD